MTATRLIALFVLLLFSGLVRAEGNCPPGYYPMGAPPTVGCAPIPSYGPKQYNRGYWSNRYGAIAVDKPLMSVAGSSKDMRSERKAKSAAIKDCKKRGGTGCEVISTFGNTCAAYAIGDTGYATMTGETRDQAAQQASDRCSAISKNCKVDFTICSEPLLVTY